MRVLFTLPGAHRVQRGAEVALESVAEVLASSGSDVTVLGTGPANPDRSYRYVKVPVIERERFESFPKLRPLLRSEYNYEEATYSPGLAAELVRSRYDITLTCAYPYSNWVLRALGRGAKHVFVTQNGDWPARSPIWENRPFGCDGLVCTNPDYYDRNKDRWNSVLIGNGVDPQRFGPGKVDPAQFGLPTGVPIVLMVSALIDSKRVDDGIRVVARHPSAHLVVAGDGPRRDDIFKLANELLPGRFHQVGIPSAEMPDLYKAADLFLHLSRNESFGNVYLEAAISGLPVVAHDTRTTRWILGDGAALLDTDVLEDTAAAVDAGLSGRGPDLQPDVIAERFGWDKIGGAYGEFFETLTTGKS